MQHADGESTEPFSSSTVCLIQRDFSQVEVAVFFSFLSGKFLGYKLSHYKVTQNADDGFSIKNLILKGFDFMHVGR